jgi:26S proteasome regulatory subunit T2
MSDKDEKKKKNPAPTARTIRRRKKKGAASVVKIPVVQPTSKCKLRLLKLERIKDFLLMEEEFIQNQEVLKPSVNQEEVFSQVLALLIHLADGPCQSR